MQSLVENLNGIPAKVADIDLEPIAVKALVEGMALSQVELGVGELRRFYTLCSKYPKEALSPSTVADALWHLHILDTLHYPKDCRRMFGAVLHHFPYLGLRDEEDVVALEAGFARTRELYQHEFGEDMPGKGSASLCTTDLRAARCGAPPCRTKRADSKCQRRKCDNRLSDERPTLQQYFADNPQVN